jgi:hypothetical protein
MKFAGIMRKLEKAANNCDWDAWSNAELELVDAVSLDLEREIVDVTGFERALLKYPVEWNEYRRVSDRLGKCSGRSYSDVLREVRLGEPKGTDETTMQDLMNFIRGARLDYEEYFSSVFDRYTHADAGVTSASPLFGRDTRDIAVWWAPGGSEGYKVHVESVDKYGVHTAIAVGKFWDPRKAAFAANLISRWVYGAALGFGKIEKESDLIAEGIEVMTRE